MIKLILCFTDFGLIVLNFIREISRPLGLSACPLGLAACLRPVATLRATLGAVKALGVVGGLSRGYVRVSSKAIRPVFRVTEPSK